MIQCVSTGRFVANLSAAILGVNIYAQDIVYHDIGNGRALFYDHGNGTFSEVNSCLKVTEKVAAKTMPEFLSDLRIDKSLHLSTWDPYDLIVEALKDAYTVGYFYFLIPKEILNLAEKKRSFIPCLNGTFIGSCRLKTGSPVNTFRDPLDRVKLNKGEEYTFFAYFDGAKCFIFVKTFDEKFDLMFKLQNPWQFNKYFTVVKVNK